MSGLRVPVLVNLIKGGMDTTISENTYRTLCYVYCKCNPSPKSMLDLTICNPSACVLPSLIRGGAGMRYEEE